MRQFQDTGPTGGRRERTKERNRAAIVQAAREVFAEIGYDAATVRDIVRRTSLATGTFYNYFPDKQSVLGAIVEEATARGRPRLHAARQQARALPEFVELGFRTYFELLAEDPLLLEIASRNAGALRATGLDETGFGLGVDELRADLAEAIDRGYLPPLDVDYMTAAMTAVGVEVAFRMAERDPVDVDGATAFTTTLFLGAIDRMAAEAHAQPPEGDDR
ncbi:MAG: TetR/AcrR family transcriptional regulator [Myxococcota bacterium]